MVCCHILLIDMWIIHGSVWTLEFAFEMFLIADDGNAPVPWTAFNSNT